MTDAVRWEPPPPPELTARAAHVWRVPLRDVDADACRALLSHAERMRAASFALPALERHYVAAHGMLRKILALYIAPDDASLPFTLGEFGKPSLAAQLEFNLSHSGDLALVAVSRWDVGVDVERWSDRLAPAELASRVFSSAECRALHALPPERVKAGFYHAWTRKEAYMKATGHGIMRGFDHFDVTLTPGESARLLADRLDVGAAEKWSMHGLHVGAGYSAALVAAAPVNQVLLFDAGGLPGPP